MREHGANGLVYLVDDDPGMVKALQRLLRAEGFEVRGYTSAAEFLQAFRPGPASCLVLDMAMPGLNGLGLQHELARHGWLIPVVFLSGNSDIPTSVLAMKAGAVDFLTKPIERESLLAAVHAALVKSSEQHALAECAQRVATLTAREREVLEHVVAGKLNKQIAADLGTGEQNVKIHRGRMMRKLGVQSLADLVRFAEKLGLRRGMSAGTGPPRGV